MPLPRKRPRGRGDPTHLAADLLGRCGRGPRPHVVSPSAGAARSGAEDQPQGDEAETWLPKPRIAADRACSHPVVSVPPALKSHGACGAMHTSKVPVVNRVTSSAVPARNHMPTWRSVIRTDWPERALTPCSRASTPVGTYEAVTSDQPASRGPAIRRPRVATSAASPTISRPIAISGRVRLRRREVDLAHAGQRRCTEHRRDDQRPCGSAAERAPGPAALPPPAGRTRSRGTRLPVPCYLVWKACG
jgi:hypothetical protein